MPTREEMIRDLQSYQTKKTPPVSAPIQQEPIQKIQLQQPQQTSKAPSREEMIAQLSAAQKQPIQEPQGKGLANYLAPYLPFLQTDSDPNIQAQEPGQMEAITQGLRSGATMGFGDELMAGAKTAIPSYIKNMLANYGLLKEGEQAPTIEETYKGYQKERDLLRGRESQVKEAYPWTTGLSDVAGSIATLNPTKLLPMLGMGALQGLGRTESDIVDDTGGVAADVAMGTALGGIGYGGGKAIQSGLGKLFGEGAGELAMSQARPGIARLKKLGGFGRATYEKAKNELKDAGNLLLKKKLLKSSAEETLSGVKGALGEVGIDDTLQHITKNYTNVKTNTGSFIKELDDFAYKIGDDIGEDFVKPAKTAIDWIKRKYGDIADLSPVQMKEIVRNIDKKINYNKTITSDTGAAVAGSEFVPELRRLVEGTLRKTIKKLAPDNIAKEYVKKNRTFQLLKAAEGMFEDEAMKGLAGGAVKGGIPSARLFETLVAKPASQYAPLAAYPGRRLEQIGGVVPEFIKKLPTRGNKLQVLAEDLAYKN